MRDIATDEIRDVEIGGVQEIGTFQIASNGKAFRILVSALYSDKPGAIVRELSSNAFDSHIANGNPERPFKLQLPTRWDSMFSVRDYGTGLTHDQIMHLYATVFASTKGNTNDQVGKFGLGSKTPFAYTDAFSVTSIQPVADQNPIVAMIDEGGRFYETQNPDHFPRLKRVYNAFMDAQNIPRIALFHSEFTDEEQGMEVSFPVQLGDIGAFKSAAVRQLMGFPVVPLNNADITQTTFNASLEGPGWKILDRNSNVPFSGPHLRQGCVIYPIDWRTIINKRPDATACRALANESLLLDMPIGSVDITPSRESLSYDDNTIDNIATVYETIIDSMSKDFQSKIDACNTRYEAELLLPKIISAINNGDLQHSIHNKIRWRGRKFQGSLYVTEDRFRRFAKLNGNSFKYARACSSRRNGNTSNWDFSYHNAVTMAIGFNGYKAGRVQRIVYCKGNLPQHMSLRLSALRELYPDPAGHDYEYTGNLILASNFTPDCFAAKAMYAMLGRPPNFFESMVDLETIEFEKPDRKQFLASVKTWYARKQEFTDAPLAEDAENVVWVQTFKHDVLLDQNSKSSMSLSDFATIWKSVNSEGKYNLVALPTSRKDVLKKIPENWKHVSEIVHEAVAELNVDRILRRKAYDEATHYSGRYEEERKINTFGNIISNISENFMITEPSSVFGNIQREMADYTGQSDDIGLFNSLPLILNTTEYELLLPQLDHKKYVKRVKDIRKELETAYPMIKLMIDQSCSASDNDDKNTVLQYVELIDKHQTTLVDG